MTLTTHILIATAVTKPFFGANPELIFGVALASHYLADAIPHWDYHLGSVSQGEHAKFGDHDISDYSRIATDLSKITFDIFLGTTIAILVSGVPLTLAGAFPVLITAAGAILPDALQPFYWIVRRWPLTWIHAFHSFMHAKTSLTEHTWDGRTFRQRGREEAARVIRIGIVSQLVILSAALFLIRS